MPQSPFSIATEVMTLFHLTDMNIFALNSNGQVLFTYGHHTIPEFLLNIQETTLTNISLECARYPGECFIYTTVAGLTYAGGGFDADDPEVAMFVIGPFLYQMPDISNLHSLFSEQETRLIMQDILNSLQLISRTKLQSIINVVQNVRKLSHVSVNTIQKNEEVRELNKKTTLLSIEEHDQDLINIRYDINNRMMQAIKRGAKDELRLIMSKSGNLFDFSERFPNQPVRATKNSLIILNTTFRIAAESGGVPPCFLHHLSEKFAIQIERIDSINTLNKLLTTMGDEYCDLVRKSAISGYSLLVQKVISYLVAEYNRPINIKQLAAVCDVHPAHLSRQFKKETGLTITHYLNHVRIDEAKWMLRKDRTSIDCISGNVGFEDASYFSRLFKKLEGVTPTDYRNNWQLHE